MELNKFLSKKSLLIITLFFIFLFFRLFIDNSSVLSGSDNLKYMHAAKNFPNHTLYNDQLYLMHPPGYPYAIYIFTLIFGDDYLAAVMISLISSVISFFVLYRFFMVITNNFKLTFFVMIFFFLHY